MFPKVAYMLHSIIRNVTSPLKERTFNISSRINPQFKGSATFIEVTYCQFQIS